MISLELRKLYLKNRDNYEYLKENVYSVIEEEISDILDYVRCYDEEEYLQVLEMVEEAQQYIDLTCTTGYKADENAVILARYLLKLLVYKKYTDRGFDVSTSVKTSEIVRNIVTKLTSYSYGVSDDD